MNYMHKELAADSFIGPFYAFLSQNADGKCKIFFEIVQK